jgi:hypothetical protein
MQARSWFTVLAIAGSAAVTSHAALAQAPTTPPPSVAPAPPGSSPGAAGSNAGTPEPAPASAPAAAAPAPEAAPAPAEPAAPAQGEQPAPKGDRTLIADAEEGSSPVERPGQTYYFLGVRYRGIVVPKFMMNIFADGGKTVYVHGIGPEFVIRKNGFEYNIGLWYAAYSMDPTLFKGNTDGEEAWELVSSKVKVLYLTSDFLWSQEFTPEFALNYGFGAGLGFVFGDLHRNEVSKDASGNYVPCSGPRGDTSANQVYYCDDKGTHYGDYTEPNWAHSGSKPIFFPWLVAQTGIRFKPQRNIVARLDLGFGTSGFFFGFGADYGL